MKAVSIVTKYFLEAFQRVERERRGTDKKCIYDECVEMLASAPADATEEQKLHAREAFVALNVANFVGEVFRSVLDAVNGAGRALVQVSNPAEFKELNGDVDADPATAAREAAMKLAMTLPVLQMVLQQATDQLDLQHLAESVWEAGQKAAAEKPQVKTKEVKGDKTGWSSRLDPSSN